MNYAALPLALVLVLAACHQENAPLARVEQAVLTAVVGESAGIAGHVYSGEVRARYESVPGFRIGGKIVERMVDAGARVKAGQALARIDPADAGLQASSADAQYQLAEAEAKRYRELRDKGFVSQSALDAKETALKAAAAQASLARNQSAYTTLRADHAAVVTATLAEAGQVVSAGQPVLRLARDGEREIAIAIPETQFADLAIGAPAEVEVGTGRFTGRLRELAPAADPASRTYPARVALSDADARAALGMTARVRFGGGEGQVGFIVPLSAIFQQGDKSAVWIVAADRSLSLRPVRISAYRDDGAVIAEGLVAGERIVSAGVHKLSAGEKVRIVESERSK
ncbi:MAG: efflux transporter periplasmic adaptor subunit [Gallionellales bacterium GWA2_60_18]|nr:MAG: efflux transporter periplasmic adaptor subunit [Gallionellales bacterium GWA2_60_18]